MSAELLAGSELSCGLGLETVPYINRKPAENQRTARRKAVISLALRYRHFTKATAKITGSRNIFKYQQHTNTHIIKHLRIRTGGMQLPTRPSPWGPDSGPLMVRKNGWFLVVKRTFREHLENIFRRFQKYELI